MIRSLVQHRGYIWRTALADVRHRYVGSSMGIVWNVLQPLAQILVFTIVFAKIMHRPVTQDGPGYVLILCSVLLPWNALAECLNRSTHALIQNAMYLRKLPIPEQVFIAQAATSSLISLSISYGLLIIVALVLGHTPTWHWMLLPIPLLLLIATGLGLGMALGTIFAFIRDIGQLLAIVLQLGFWSYPVVYDLQIVPEWMQRLIPYNPVYPFFEAIRDLFLRAHMPEPAIWVGMLCWLVIAWCFGSMVLHKLRPEIRDVL